MFLIVKSKNAIPGVLRNPKTLKVGSQLAISRSKYIKIFYQPREKICEGKVR